MRLVVAPIRVLSTSVSGGSRDLRPVNREKNHRFRDINRYVRPQGAPSGRGPGTRLCPAAHIIWWKNQISNLAFIYYAYAEILFLSY